MEVSISVEHVRAMSHHLGQCHVLQIRTILYDYTKVDSMTPMVIIDFGGDDTFIHVPKEHCHFNVGMEPSMGGPLFNDSEEGGNLQVCLAILQCY